MNTQQKWIIENRLSFEAEKDGLLEYFTKEVLARFKRDSGQDAAVYYFTFYYNDYDNRLIRMRATNKQEKWFIATFPNNVQVEEGFEMLKRLNAHLNLQFMEAGLHEDDFIRDRTSYKIAIVS